MEACFRHGGQRRMGIETASTSTPDTTLAINTQTVANASFLSGLGTNSSCAPNEVMQYSYGASSLMTASTSEQASDKKASTARSSETRASTYRHHSFAKRMQSLMQRGLIAGITPTSIAKRSPQATLDIAFSKPDGVDAGTPKAGCLYLSESSE